MKVVVLLLLFFVSMLGDSLPLSPFPSSAGASSRRVASSIDKRLNTELLKEQELVVEDYGLVDPTPATKTRVGPKPIDHGSPLIPFIPQQPPQTPPPPTVG